MTRVKIINRSQGFYKFVTCITLVSLFISSVLIFPGKANASPLGLNSHYEDRDQRIMSLSEETSEHQFFMPFVNGFTSYKPEPNAGNWPMVGANPSRNSWTSEEVRGNLYAEWYKPFDPYIMQKVQIIAEYGNLYISTARGLYALDASTGAQKWVYPTEMPLGHSPTVVDGVAYVGGFDHKLHAVDAYSGDLLWKFSAGAGFDTNPLVVGDLVFAGNRDGFFYAVYTQGAQQGKLAWKYKTDGPIHFSAAYKDGTVYFASNDSYAYALEGATGDLVWKSDKLPGAGFHSWWPVIYGHYVIFAGSNNYRTVVSPGPNSTYTNLELGEIYPNHKQDPRGTLVGPSGEAPGFWVDGTPTIDTSKANNTRYGSTTAITEYFETKPWRRTYIVLNRSNGAERTYDFDDDGKREFAPVLWVGTQSGNRYPPVVGIDGILYQGNNYYSDEWIAGGHISGWMLDTPNIGIVMGGWNAVDEPVAYSAGGNLIYWNRCCDRVAGAVDISIPLTGFQASLSKEKVNAADRSWSYFSYNLPDKVPGYNSNTYIWDPYYKPYGGIYGGRNGSYGFHGDVNPPIPYEGKVYMHRGNSIIAFSPGKKQATSLPMAGISSSNNADVPPLSDNQIITLLESEAEKILAAGHLRPGYSSTGFLEFRSSNICGADLLDYWHNPSDTIYTLIRALPYLSEPLHSHTKSYLQNEFITFPPNVYEHIGWRDGAPREAFDLPPEVESDRLTYGPKTSINLFKGWDFSPYSFYALWKYAQVFGDAKTIFDESKSQLAPAPSNELLIEMPHINNVFIAGYWGYLELEKLAGYSETTQVRNELIRLLSLRVSTFTKDASNVFFQVKNKYYCRNYNSSQNFMFLVPELAQYLRVNAVVKVQDALAEYERVTPLWFASNIEAAFAEGTINHLYDSNAIFQAKTMILNESRDEMTKYLDVPGFMVGDLFYIQNLISLLESTMLRDADRTERVCEPL